MFGRRRSRAQDQDVSTVTIAPGMTKDEVEGLLGRPRNSFSEAEYRQGRPMAMAGGGEDRLSHNEYWFYQDFPKKGITTMITFHKGKVHHLTQRH